ncbi:MAG: hypothetical protein K1V99_03135 [Bacteroidales bacterium]
MAAYTIEQYLRGKVDYDTPAEALKAILFDNNVEAGAPVEQLDERTRDLCLADLLMWLSSTSTATSGEYISDGGWQQQKSNKNVFDRDGLRRRAMAIYAKWAPEKSDAAKGNPVRMKPLY